MDMMERFIAKEPIEIKESIDIEWLCPSCKTKVGDIVNVDNYCRNCVQKILFN